MGGQEFFFSGRTQGEKGKACGRIGKLRRRQRDEQ